MIIWPKHMCSSSDGLSLNFIEEDEDLYQEFVKREKELRLDIYGKIRQRHGIWAGNKMKFVKNREELTRWDGTLIEDEYQKYIGGAK